MATKLSLVLFPKAGAFTGGNFFDHLDLTETEDPDHDPVLFSQKVDLVSDVLNLPVKSFAMVSAGHTVFPAAYLDLKPNEKQLIPLLERKFSVRRAPEKF